MNNKPATRNRKDEMTYLIFASDHATDPIDSHRVFSTDDTELWVRAVLYRGGADPMQYGEHYARRGETFVNIVNVPASQK